ncbi:tonB-dependent hemin [alpha proteobacterium U9-1i]|nr:tonB-dependent hemin [alpha proteobacterium U9-1i]
MLLLLRSVRNKAHANDLQGYWMAVLRARGAGRRRRLRGATALVVLMGLGGLGGGAASAAEAEDGAAGEGDIVVTATRTAKDQFEVPATSTVITDEEIEAHLVTDIKDLIRFEPGISVPTSPSRFGAALAATGRDGNSGFNIRGMGGNRVLFQVDGVRLPDGFSFGPNAFGRGDYIDLDLLSSVEIVRGPASALYGSDGLAGVVSFITKDPNDFLFGDETFGARARVSYASVDESWAENLTGAWRLNDQWSVLAAYTRRDGHETDNQGDNNAFAIPPATPAASTRTAPNPQTFESNAVLGRLVFEPNDAHRVRVTAEYGDRFISTDAISGRTSTVARLTGEDESERMRYALDYTLENEGGLIDSAFVAVYQQSSWARQISYEDRSPAVDRTRETIYDNDVWGLTAQAESVFEGAIQNRFVYGVDHSVTTSGAIRGGTVPTPPAVFPERPFPETEFTRTGVFLVDEISLMDGAVTLFPGVRHDSYDISPNRDALYVFPLFEQDGTHLSPKFGIVAWPTEHVGAFFNYAEGFKSPAPTEVNNFIENLALASLTPPQAYTSIPNTNLGPETSQGFEAGVRGRDWRMFNGLWDLSVAAFAVFYDDFISQQITGGNGTALTPFTYQFVNLNQVDISGVEARASANWQSGVGLNLAMAWAEGDQTVSGVESALQSTDPFTLVAGISYNEPSGRYGGELSVTWTVEKDANEVTAGTVNPDGFTIFDLTSYVNVSEAATLRVGVFNITDETYSWWNDVRGLSAASTTLDAYTQPGRNVSASISYRF